MACMLDKDFMPMINVINDFKMSVSKEKSQRLIIRIERNKGFVSGFELDVYKDNTGRDEDNYDVIERLIKSILWVKGGYITQKSFSFQVICL